jgi:Na+/proline symporter
MSSHGNLPGDRAGSIAAILSKGDIVRGHRSRERAQGLLADFKRALGMPADDHKLVKAMLDFIIEVVLGAAWYQKRCDGTKWKVRSYIVLNYFAVIGLPIALLGLLWLGENRLHGSTPSMIVSQLTGVLTGILALQKTLSVWYSSQRRYAAWYKSASDLKTLYYSFIQQV